MFIFTANRGLFPLPDSPSRPKARMASLRPLLRGILIVLCTLLGACGPIYQTRYAYHPIAGRQAQMCTNTCEVSKLQCQQSAEQLSAQCRMQAQTSYQLCEASKVFAYNRKGEWECISNCYCYVPSCDDPDYGRCEETYKDCFLNCGGTVTATTACVQFCEKAQAPQIQRLKKTEEGVVVDMNSASYEEPVSNKPRAKSSQSSRSSTKGRSAGGNASSAEQPDAEAELERLNAELRAKTAAPAE